MTFYSYCLDGLFKFEIIIGFLSAEFYLKEKNCVFIWLCMNLIFFVIVSDLKAEVQNKQDDESNMVGKLFMQN